MNREGGGEEKGRRRGLQNQWGFLAGNGSLSIINSSSCPPLATSSPSLPLLLRLSLSQSLSSCCCCYSHSFLYFSSSFSFSSQSSPLFLLVLLSNLLFLLLFFLFLLHHTSYSESVCLWSYSSPYFSVSGPRSRYPSASIPILFFLFASTFYFSMNFFLFLTAFVSSPL